MCHLFLCFELDRTSSRLSVVTRHVPRFQKALGVERVCRTGRFFVFPLDMDSCDMGSCEEEDQQKPPHPLPKRLYVVCRSAPQLTAQRVWSLCHGGSLTFSARNGIPQYVEVWPRYRVYPMSGGPGWPF